MIVLRTLSLLVLTALLSCALACAGEPPVDEPPVDEPFVPEGPPALELLVDVDPEDDAEGFRPVLADERVRYGDPFTIVVRNLFPDTNVTLEAELYGMTSSATFVATADGTVDLRRDAPLAGGSYEGVDAEGLLWSTNGLGAVGPLDLNVYVRALVDGEEAATATLARKFINEEVDVEEVADGRTRGLLAIPRGGEGPFPAVLVFGGSEGGTGSGEFAAMYLASLGVASLGVGYFGAAGLPDELVDVPLEILEEDLVFLASDPRIDAERIAVMGGSRGGELALLLGEKFPAVVKGVIATVPSGLVWGGNPDVFTTEVAAWTLDGVALPYVPYGGGQFDVDTDDSGEQHVRMRNAFLQDIDAASADALAAATIRAELTEGPVLLLAGDDDQLWPSCPLADVAFARLVDAGREGDRMLCFADAGHAFGTPGWSTMESRETYRTDMDAFLVLGGTPQGNARAGRDADTAIRAFLRGL